MSTVTQTDTDGARQRADAARTSIRRLHDVPRVEVDKMAKDVLHLANEVEALRAALALKTDH